MGYFFVDARRGRLRRLRPILVAAGYRYVDMFPVNADGDPRVFLHVERVERHTADSLFRRCTELDALGAEHDTTFDGFDVGNVDGSPLYA